MLLPSEAKEFSGFNPYSHCIPVLKRGNFFIRKDSSVDGDAPKDLIKIYEYDGRCRKQNKHTWPTYIAKIGHKHYPNESITEYFLNKAGEELGLNIAASRLMYIGGTLRFCSKSFKGKDILRLLHGAEIFSAYLNNDLDFVKSIEDQNKAREYFTVEFVQKAFDAIFENHSKRLFRSFCQLLLFDALAGNNDRHFYNWCILLHKSEQISKAAFSPIYDTARGLYWNEHENAIVNLLADKQLDKRIQKYCEGSRPKIGWDGKSNINHFELVQELLTVMDEEDRCFAQQLYSNEMKQRLFRLLNVEFRDLMSAERRTLIQHCLTYRFYRLNQLVSVC